MSARGVWEGRCRCTALASLFVVARVERVPLYLWLCVWSRQNLEIGLFCKILTF